MSDEEITNYKEWTKGLIDKHKTHELKLILCPVKDFRKDCGEFWRKSCMRLQGGVSVSMSPSGKIKRLFFHPFVTSPNMFRHITGLVWSQITHIGYVDTSKNEIGSSTSDGVHDIRDKDNSEQGA